MGKLSFASKDAVVGGMGIQEGNVEIVAACGKVHQFPPNKKSGNQSAPFCCAAIQLQRLDKDMNPTEDEPQWEYLTYGKDSLEKYHPGNASSPDDDDPEDLGSEVDTEGNTIFVVDESAKLRTTCKWMIFAKSLEAQGFKPDILGRGYFPDLVGTKGHVKTLTMEKIDDSDKAPTCLVFDKIVVYPYSKGGAKKAAAPAKSGKAATAPPADEDADNPADEKAREVMTELSVEYSGKPIPVKKIAALAQTKMIRARTPGKLQKQALDLIGSAEWLGEKGYEVEDGAVTFA